MASLSTHFPVHRTLRCLPTHSCIAEAAGALPVCHLGFLSLSGGTPAPSRLPESLSLHREAQVARNFRPPTSTPPGAALNLLTDGFGSTGPAAQQPCPMTGVTLRWESFPGQADSPSQGALRGTLLSWRSSLPALSSFLPSRLFLRIVLLLTGHCPGILVSPASGFAFFLSRRSALLPSM